MSTRTTKVVLEASIGQYESNLRKASKATDELAKSATESGRATDRAGKQAEQGSQQSSKASRDAAKAHKEAEKAARERADAVKKVGTAMLAFGTVTVAALGATAKAAIEWESAWAGVNKTVDGTPEQMAELEGELRGLAKTLPLTHAEIAGVAEAAGQLGIAREDITGFTKTMIDLGETTNLSAQEAATSMAQFMNVMGTAPDQVDNLGSALVALGNNGASTEKDILSMAQRIAGSGALVGATEADVLALSNTLASLGIRAEAGGGSASRVLLQMYNDVEENGENLERFAKVAGMSAQEFATAFREDPIGAMDTFSQGLNRVQGEGGNVVGTLKDLGITATEDTRTLLALAGSGDMLSDSMSTSSEEVERNTALIEEAAKRYETTEAKISTAWNNIKDAAIDAGGVLLPIIAGVAESVAGLAEWFGKLPEPAQATLTIITGLAGAASLAGGAFMLFLPKVQQTRKALRDLGSVGQKADRALGKVGVAAGVATAALVGFEILRSINNSMAPAAAGLEEVANKMVTLGESTADLDTIFQDAGWNNGEGMGVGAISGIDGVGDAITRLQDMPWWETLSDKTGDTWNWSDSWSAARDDISSVDKVLSTMAGSGDFEQAAAGFQNIAKGIEEAGGNAAASAANDFPEYQKALEQLGTEYNYTWGEGEMFQAMLGNLPPALEAAMSATDGAAGAAERQAAAAEEAAVASEEMQKALAEIGVSAQGTVSDLTDFTNSLVSAGLLTLSTRDSARQYEASLDALSASIAENGTTLDLNTEAGRANEAALDGIASAGLSYAEALATETDQLGRNVNSQADVSAALQQTYDDYYANATAMGYNTEKATALTREVMGIPDDVSIETFMEETAKLMAEATTGAAIAVPDSVRIDSSMSEAAKLTADATKRSADDVPEQETIDSWMADEAFMEAVRTRAAALDIPESEAIDSFMSSAARNEADATTAEVLGIPEGASVSSFMENYARIEAEATRAALNRIPSRIYTQVVTEKVTILSTKKGASYAPPGAGRFGPAGFMDGGRIPKHADGGRLPLTGPGTSITDGILGISSLTGEPTSYVDAGEWVVREEMAAKFNGLLNGVNADAPDVQHLAGAINTGTPRNLPGYADGARIGRQHSVSNYYAAPAAAPASSDTSGQGVNIHLTSYNAVAQPDSKLIETAHDQFAALVGG